MTGWWAASYVVLWIVVLVLGVILLAVLRQLGLVYLNMGGGLGARQTAAGPRIGEIVDLPERYHPIGNTNNGLIPHDGRVGLLFFLSPTCSVCDEMLPDLPSFARSVRREASVAVVLNGPDRDGKFADWPKGSPHVFTDDQLEKAYSISAYPYGVAIDAAGRVLSKGTVNNLVQFESILNDAQSQLHQDRPTAAIESDRRR